MRATAFEYGYQALLHLLVVGLALLSYVIDPVDIVWAAVRNHADNGNWERLVFGFGAVLLFVSAAPDTWANAHNRVRPDEVPIRSQQHKLRLARILLVLTIGLLLSLPGTIILLTGETILIVRLFLYKDESAIYVPLPSHCTRTCWRSGFRIAASKWGLTATMIAFVWTLQDRVAELGAACSVAVWILLNIPPRRDKRPQGA
jgi:hypothetical protein